MALFRGDKMDTAVPMLKVVPRHKVRHPRSGVSRVEEPRKIGEKIWRRMAFYPTQQKRARYGPLFCPKQTLLKVQVIQIR